VAVLSRDRDRCAEGHPPANQMGEAASCDFYGGERNQGSAAEKRFHRESEREKGPVDDRQGGGKKKWSSWRGQKKQVLHLH